MIKVGGVSVSNAKTAWAAMGVALAVAGSLLFTYHFRSAAAQLNSSTNEITPTNQIKPIGDNSAAGSSVKSEESFNNVSSNQGSSTQSSNHTSVTVNGQSIPVPKNGSFSKTVHTEGGTTTVNVESHNASQGSSGGAESSSLEVNVDSSSTAQEGP